MSGLYLPKKLLKVNFSHRKTCAKYNENNDYNFAKKYYLGSLKWWYGKY